MGLYQIEIFQIQFDTAYFYKRKFYSCIYFQIFHFEITQIKDKYYYPYFNYTFKITKLAAYEAAQRYDFEWFYGTIY